MKANSLSPGQPASETPFKGRWWPNIECWLGSFVFVQEIRTSIAKKPYIFVIFQGGPDPCPPPPSGSAHAKAVTGVEAFKAA